MTDPHSEPLTPTRSDRANSFPWPPVLLGAAVLSAWALSRFVPLPWPGQDDTPARVIGLSFGVAGLILIFWAVATLMRSGTTVMPDGVSTALVTTGPYAVFRNPIYLGETLALLGLAEVSKSIWFVGSAILFVPLITVLQILPEERHLEAKFGSAYREYRARTRRWLRLDRTP